MNDVYYSELEKLGANIEEIKKLCPTERQLEDLIKGMLKLHFKHASTEAS
jgi:hypothetical protein